MSESTTALMTLFTAAELAVTSGRLGGRSRKELEAALREKSCECCLEDKLALVRMLWPEGGGR